MQGVEIMNLKTPYPGLRPFESEERPFFYGRERQLDELLRKLRGNRFLAVVGSNGNGKSSFIKAMLLPRLEEGFVGQRGSKWRVAVCTPGNNPLENLSRELAAVLHGEDMMDPSYPSRIETMLRSSSLGLVETYQKSAAERSKENLMIVIDQFEEVFPFSNKNLRNEDDASTFVNLLLNASRQKDVPVYIVLTMRAGYIGACSEFRGLAEAINDGQFLIPRVKPEDLKRIILSPIASERSIREIGAEITMEDTVYQNMIADIGKNTNELGTLQHTLLRTWQHWMDTENDIDVPISMKHYKAIGTLKGALSKHAEQAYSDLDTEEKRIICERIFRAMVEKGGKGEYESRSVTIKDMMDVTGRSLREVRLVVYTFSQQGRRFLDAPPVAEMDEDSVVSIAHDSLIKRWARLREWANEETEAAEMYRRLCTAAILYQEGKGSLWVDPELKMGLKWYDPETYDEDAPWRLEPNENWSKRYENPDIEYKTAIQFLQDSEQDSIIIETREKENFERKETNRRRIGIVGLVTILFCLGMAGVALWSAARAKRQARVADKAVTESRRQQYLAELSEQEAARQGFYAMLSAEKAVKEKAQAERASMTAMEATRIAEARARQALSAERLAKLKEQQALEAQEDARRKEQLALAAQALAEKKEKEAQEQKRIALTIKGLSLAQSIAVKSWKEEDEGIQGLLAKEAYDLNAVNGGKLDDAYIYEAVYKALDRLNETNKAYPNFNALDQVPEGRTRVGQIRRINVSESGDKIYTVGSDGLLLKWNFDIYGSKSARKEKTNKPEILSANLSVARALDISPDGKSLARAGDAAQVLICNTSDGAVSSRIDANQGRRIWDLRYTPSGKGVITVGDDGTGGTTIAYTNLSGGSSPIIGETPFKVTSIDIASNGKYVAGIGSSSEVWIWNIDNQLREYLLSDPKSNKHATSVDFNPQGRFVAVGYQDGTLMVWDLNKVEENPAYVPEKFLNHGAGIEDVEFSADGTQLVVGSMDGTATLWSIRDLDYKGYGDDREFPYLSPKFQPIKFDSHEKWVTSVAFSADGTRVVTGTKNGHLRIWETDMTLYADQICDIIRQNLSNKSWRKYVGTDDPRGRELYIETSDGGRRIPFSTCGEQVPQMKERKTTPDDDDNG
jgi:WD40 repeat protein/energy-coupling factor transporter ATP-binding protein EcfA2